MCEWVWCNDVLMKWCGQGKSEALGVKCVLVQLREPRISHRLACDGIRASVVRVRRGKHVIEPCWRLCWILSRMITTLDYVRTVYLYLRMHVHTYIWWSWQVRHVFYVHELLEQGRVTAFHFSPLPHYIRSTICPYFPDSESSSAKEFDWNANTSDTYSDVRGSNVDETLTLLGWHFLLFLSVPLWQMLEYYVKLGYNHFLPH